jgi:hypothetical protein
VQRECASLLILVFQVIHNPGVIPDPRFNGTRPDITVLFEGNYSAWEKRGADVFALRTQRAKHGVMINSVPDVDKDGLQSLISSIGQMADYIFVTSNSHDVYDSFSPDWPGFVDAMAIVPGMPMSMSD